MWDEKLGLIAAFINSGEFGLFITEDESIAELLRKHPLSGKAYKEVIDSHPPKFQPEPEINYKVEGNQMIPIIVGEKKTEPIEFSAIKLVRYGELKGLLLKPDGELKKTASKELIEEFKKLKVELGV
jgi:hypothetical protein